MSQPADKKETAYNNDVLAQTIRHFFESRNAQRQAFMAQAGWGKASCDRIGEDMGRRRYYRLQMGKDTAILMESIPDDSELASPGHKITDFIRIAAYLSSIGVQVPSIYASAEKFGYLLLEDFGNESFRRAIHEDEKPSDLYSLATDVLINLRETAKQGDIELPEFYRSHVYKGRRFLVNWYIPTIRKALNPSGMMEEYLSVWDGIETDLDPCPTGFLHVDFHFENLMWMKRKKGIRQCGVIDFQGAMWGPVVYDLANLLEDARLSIPQSLRDKMIAKYCVGLSAQDEKLFRSWYRILATQFHCRVLGQFIKIAVNERQTRYLEHIPRVSEYINIALQDPILKPLKDWFDLNKISFDQAPNIDVGQLFSFLDQGEMKP
jgi:N-acetylmuramate 1-kinase